LSGKQICKKALLQLFERRPSNLARPVLGIVSRFADQKGFDLIAERAHELMQEDLALVVLGTGDRRYEDLFRSLADAYPGRVGVKIAYDDAVATRSKQARHVPDATRYEPCGLNQVYSLKYGTVPIVRATGGLDDTIKSFDVEHAQGPASSSRISTQVARWSNAFGRPCNIFRMSASGNASN
jgi:starch synthase